MSLREQADEYCRALARLSGDAVLRFSRIFNALRDKPPEAVRDALLEAVPAICEAYGNAAGALAATCYEQQIEEGARLSDLVPAEQVVASVRYAAGFLFDGRPDSTHDILAARIKDVVRQAANDTMVGCAIRHAGGDA